MAFNLASISAEQRIRAPRIILLGVEKIGKSTFAAQSDSPVFISIDGEEGVDALGVAKFPTCYSYSDVMQCITSLCNEDHNYHTVVIDSASALNPIIADEICKASHVKTLNNANGGFGGGVQELEKQWIQLKSALDYLRNTKNMASIIIGHVKVDRFDDPLGSSYSTYNFAIHDRVRDLLFHWADAILFCNTKSTVKKEDLGFNKEHAVGIDTSGGQRFLYTQKRPSHPGGGRDFYGRLPYELPLNYGSFIDAVSAAVKQQ